jgi:high-affinity iron transporter
MLATGLISFREFLEAFLIVGVFLGISKKLNLKKEFEISIAAIVGIMISLFMAAGTYAFGDRARGVLTEKNAELLESYLMIFSGFFLAYVILSLHSIIHRSHAGTLIKAHKKLQENVFDVSLFMTIVFLVVREGFEIALFTASTSLFSAFMQNFIGLMAGFAAATVIGMGTFLAYIKFPLSKVFKATEYMIVLLGAALVQKGLTELLEHGYNIHLDRMFALPFGFLPAKSTFIGHFISSFTGIDQKFSLVRLAIMAGYVGIVYLLFIRQNKSSVKS